MVQWFTVVLKYKSQYLKFRVIWIFLWTVFLLCITITIDPYKKIAFTAIGQLIHWQHILTSL